MPFSFCILFGSFVGFALGLIGGGFVIVPALVLFTAIPIKNVVATSLLVILRVFFLAWHRMLLMGAKYLSKPPACFSWVVRWGYHSADSLANGFRTCFFKEHSPREL